MLSQKDQLTELIRDLETQEHIFVTDPLLITEKIKLEKASKNPSTIEKLHRRAERIDSNGRLAYTLYKIETRIQTIIIILSVLWCVSGFMGLFALLQADIVNFFYVLVCILGFHTVVLVGWIIMTVFGNRDKPTLFAVFVSPKKLIRGKDDITTSAVKLYERQLHHSGMRWYLGKLTHQLWLATLTGMLLSMLVLLAVKDFSFAWESTLLSADTVAMVVRALAWLPDMVGFMTPSTEQIIQSQQFAHSQLTPDEGGVSSYEWAMLLISSLLMYGIVPRAILWGLCNLIFHHKKMHLDLQLPYYQKIIDFWSTEVVDKDDLDTISSVSPSVTPLTAKLSTGKKLIALLEYPADEGWYNTALASAKISQPYQDGLISNGQVSDNIDIFGIIDSRDDFKKILDYLSQNDVQVLMGIQLKALPDRGTIRKLNQINQSASKGLVVQLLNTLDMPKDKQQYQQWIHVLNEHNIACIQSQ